MGFIQEQKQSDREQQVLADLKDMEDKKRHREQQDLEYQAYSQQVLD